MLQYLCEIRGAFILTHFAGVTYVFVFLLDHVRVQRRLVVCLSETLPAAA